MVGSWDPARGARAMRVDLLEYKDHCWTAEVPLHSRTHGAVMLVRDGNGRLAVGESVHRVRSGDVVIYLPREPHSYQPDPGASLTATVITFVPADDPASSAVLERLGSRRHFDSMPESATLCDLIGGRAQSDLEYERQAAEHLLASLICMLVASVDPEPAGNRIPAIDAAMEQLYVQVDTRLADVASDLGVTPEAIRKQFQRHFGESPMHYFSAYHSRRIAVALRETDATLRELADRFGFSDEFHLSRVFKRHMGVSPAQYRQSVNGRPHEPS